ncbi:hypothetical protein [Falsiroseomonas sp.]|uniref:hypothetical protein n=1 Tax=Falsiroseomonas sp. TaxID=2870721 RepID=UPI00356743F5
MRNLLQDADRDRLVAPLADALVGEVSLGGQRFRALGEAKGSALFPLAANAAAAELLLLPGLREAHGQLSDTLLDFVMAMADAEPACRRAVGGRIEVRRDDPRDFDILTPFFRLTGDLSRGELHQAPRAPGGPVLLHSGNLVEFRIGRRRSCADVEEAITDCAVERQGNRVVLRHAGTIRGAAGLLAPRQVAAGRLEVAYELRPDSPVLRVTVRFTAARRLRGLRLTTALDALDESGLGANAARLRKGAAWREPAPPAAPGTARWAEGIPVSHLALGRAGWPAGGPVLHLRPLAPGGVASVTAEARRPGAVHWLLLRHGPVDLEAGGAMVVREDRLLTAGGEVARVAAMMAAEPAGLDLDPAPPSGAALHAVATALLFDGSPDALPAPRRAALTAFAARQAVRVAAAEDPEELAWGLLGADTLRRAGDAEAPALMARLLERLAARLPAGTGPAAAQAVALLASARAATWPDGGRAAAALPGRLAPLAAEDGLPTASVEALALVARASGAVVLAGGQGVVLPEATLAQAQALHRRAVNLLRPMVRSRDGQLVVAPQRGPATAPQVLVTLALLAPDRLALAIRAPERVDA